VYAELILVAAVPFALAALIGYFLPNLSRAFLGPAVILLTVVGCVILTKELERASDAWGAVGYVVVLAGAVGFVTGLILITVGAVRASRAPRSMPKLAAPAEVKPFRMPGPGLFTPARLFVVATIVFPVLLFLALVFSL
jgi:hypothetical protein